MLLQVPLSVSPVGDAIVLCRNNDERVWTAAMAASEDPAPPSSRYSDGLSDDVVAAARLLKLAAAPVDGECALFPLSSCLLMGQ